MREIRKLVWASVVAAAAVTPVAAQQGTSTTINGQTTTNLTGTGGLTGGGAGQLGGTGGINSGGGGGGGLGGGGLGGTELQGTQLQTMQAAPQLTAPTGTATNSLQRSNFLAGYYANPYFQGQITSQTNAVPGGFGQALYGTTGTAGTGRVGGTTGGRLGGGIGGQTNQQSGILIPVQVQMAYTARMQFPTPPVAGTKIVADIRSVIDNTPMIANAKGVQIITDANNNVTIRGAAADANEAALIEGLVRITPGVGTIKNELAVPATTASR